MKTFNILKQNTEQGCLATCYWMVKNDLIKHEEFTIEKETHLTSRAFSKETGFSEAFFINEFAKLGLKLKVLSETPYVRELYTNIGSVNSEHTLIGIETIEELLEQDYKVITNIDLWDIDMYFHFIHYVIIDKTDDRFVYIKEPKYGVELKFSKTRFADCIKSVKNKLNYSPVIFAVKK